MTIATLSANPGVYTWRVPPVDASTCRLRIRLFRKNSPLGSDASDADFAIAP